MNYNHVTLIGRLTRDPEVSFSTKGTQLAKFGLAVSRTYNDETDFFSCVAFGKTAEFIANHMTKGRLVCVDGEIQINKFEKDGEKKTYPSIVCKQIIALEKKDQAVKDASKGNEPEFFGSDQSAESDEIPF